MWDCRQKKSIKTFNNRYQITTVCYDFEGQNIYAAGLGENILCWDARVISSNDNSTNGSNAVETGNEPKLVLFGHKNTITSISLSPDGNYLLSNSMDNTLKVWYVFQESMDHIF